MSHPLDWNAGASINLFLEGKDDQHPVGYALHRLHPAWPPRPQLRADVVDDRHAELAHGVREPEIEVGKIDRDEHIGSRRGGVGQQPTIDRVGARKDARHFQEAGDRQALEVVNQGRACAAEPLAAEASNHCGRIESKEFAGQRAGVEVPGRLTAGDHDAHGSGVAPRTHATAAGGSRNRP